MKQKIVAIYRNSLIRFAFALLATLVAAHVFIEGAQVSGQASQTLQSVVRTALHGES